MADISKIKLNGTTYTIKDATARANSGISQTDADNRYLKLSGGTLTGTLDLSQNNIYGVRSLQFGNSTQTVGQIYGAGNTDDGYIIYFAGSSLGVKPRLAHVGAPINADDAVTKTYLETAISEKTVVTLKTWTSADVS